jgi:hypothetical protein
VHAIGEKVRKVLQSVVVAREKTIQSLSGQGQMAAAQFCRRRCGIRAQGMFAATFGTISLPVSQKAALHVRLLNGVSLVVKSGVTPIHYSKTEIDPRRIVPTFALNAEITEAIQLAW